MKQLLLLALALALAASAASAQTYRYDAAGRVTQVIYADDTTTRTYARLYRQLRSQGTPIPINDLWIAALVVEHNLTLCSRDRHFDHLPQIEIV